jgi:hypothetical protein
VSVQAEGKAGSIRGSKGHTMISLKNEDGSNPKNCLDVAVFRLKDIEASAGMSWQQAHDSAPAPGVPAAAPAQLHEEDRPTAQLRSASRARLAPHVTAPGPSGPASLDYEPRTL